MKLKLTLAAALLSATFFASAASAKTLRFLLRRFSRKASTPGLYNRRHDLRRFGSSDL